MRHLFQYILYILYFLFLSILICYYFFIVLFLFCKFKSRGKEIVKSFRLGFFKSPPPHEDKQKLANEMGLFFFKKIVDIRLDLDNHDKQQASTDCVSNDIEIDSLLFKFISLSQEEVHDLVRASSKKSCGLDPIPTKLLLDCLDVLLQIVFSNHH